MSKTLRLRGTLACGLLLFGGASCSDGKSTVLSLVTPVSDPEAEIGDFVWQDKNANGVQDPGEPGIADVRVVLLDGDEEFLEERTTGAGGVYCFEELQAGTYFVRVDPESDALKGLLPTSCDAGIDDAIDSDCSPAQVDLDTNESEKTVDFGFTGCGGSIGDFVWYDSNADGLQQPEEGGLEGVRVTLRDGSGGFLDETLTVSGGWYEFTGLCSGAYLVEVQDPEGFRPSPCGVGTDDSVDNDCSPALVVLGDDFTRDPTVDFGFRSDCPPGAVIGDLVWDDVNGDGIRDPGEPGIEGVRVRLEDELGLEIAVFTTLPEGHYLFAGLCAGRYVVLVETPEGFVPSPCNVGSDDTVDNDCSPVSVTLENHDTIDLTVDFGFTSSPCTGTGTIGDFVWNDLNRNGIQDEDDGGGSDDGDDDDGGDDDDDGGDGSSEGEPEPGLEGVTVHLSREIGGDFVQVATVTTDAYGLYTFMHLCAGRYRVDVETPEGFVPSLCDVGSDDAIDNDCSGAVVVLPTDDAQDDSVDFGFIGSPPAEGVIGDLVWFDANCDGIQDEGEEGLEGVTVVLLDDLGDPVDPPAVTDRDGRYLFQGLFAGRYTVVVDPDTLPPGFVPSLCNVEDDALDDVDNDCSPAVVVLSRHDGVDLSVDFGYIFHGGPEGDEGCPPGYWKRVEHFDSWPPGFDPNTPFATVFEDAFPGASLLEVLDARGGGLNALGRQTVAALLNAASDEVQSELATSEVLQLFDDLFPATLPEYNALKDFFEQSNACGCPLD